VKVLVTGASGFLGSALLRRITRDSRYMTVAALRRESSNLPDGVEIVRIDDLGVDTDWRDALESIQIVVHTAARVHVMKDSSHNPLAEYRKINVEGTLNLARQAALAKVKRFIFISTIKVNGEATLPGELFTADDPPHPRMLMVFLSGKQKSVYANWQWIAIWNMCLSAHRWFMAPASRPIS